MDAFDDIEDSIRRREEQIEARELRKRLERLEVSTSVPKTVRPFKNMTAAGKFCLFALAAIVATHIASSLGTVLIILGVGIVLIVRLVAWVAFALGLAWIIYQLLLKSS